ncbi:MAG TPA: four helix bundle protein [Actinobacteria bacterium]|nr:four helix bundle protein [Actinomycetota bacterium]
MEDKIFSFEKLNVWNEARKFAHSVFKLTKKVNNKRYFSVNQQLERAAISISLNVAEGAGRKSKADFKRFIKISNGFLSTKRLLFYYS